MGNSGCKYKDERVSLTEAFDDRSQKILSWDEVKELWGQEGKFLIRCPECSEKITLVNGEIRNGFFKHFHTGERKQTEGRRNMGGGTSAWHHRWQMCFPGQREKQLTHGEDRADVLLKDKKIAVEFQKSDFTGTEIDTCKKRTAYWNGKGYKIVWVFAWDGGSEFAGYFPRGTGRDGNEQTVMELPEYTKLFGEHVISRENVEIHFLSLDGSFGFEFLPEVLDKKEKVVRGKIISSYFQSFAPAYRPEFGKIRGKEVYNSHLKEPMVEPINIELFYQAMKDYADKIKTYTVKPCMVKPQENFLQKKFTLYELIQKSLKKGIKVLIVQRIDSHGTVNGKYKVYPQDYEYFIERYAKYPAYTFRIRGKVRKSDYRRTDGGGYIATDDIYFPDKYIWKPEWAVTNDDKNVGIEEFYK